MVVILVAMLAAAHLGDGDIDDFVKRCEASGGNAYVSTERHVEVRHDGQASSDFTRVVMGCRCAIRTTEQRAECEI